MSSGRSWMISVTCSVGLFVLALPLIATSVIAVAAEGGGTGAPVPPRWCSYATVSRCGRGHSGGR